MPPIWRPRWIERWRSEITVFRSSGGIRLACTCGALLRRAFARPRYARARPGHASIAFVKWSIELRKPAASKPIVLVSSAFALLAFWLHLRHRQDGGRAAQWLSLVAVVAGLAAGEMALGALAFIAVYECLGRRESLARRAAAVAPAASIAALYVVGYVATGYGAHASGGYIGLGSGTPGEGRPPATAETPSAGDPPRRAIHGG